MAGCGESYNRLCGSEAVEFTAPYESFEAYLKALDWVYDGLDHGYLNWRTFKIANDKLDRALNGSWMFEEGK